MKLYLKIAQFLKPYSRAIAASLVLALIYVLLNNLSLWVSVEFIQELFTPQKQSAPLRQSLEKEQPPSSGFGLLKSKNTYYKKVKNYIKSYLIRDNKYDTLMAVCLVIFFSFLFKNIVFYIRKVLLAYIEINMVIDIRNTIFRSLLFLPLRFFERRPSGDITSIAFNDVNAVNLVLNESFGKMVLAPVQIIANIVILVFISWKLSLITFVVIPFSALVITKIGQSIRRKNRRVFKEISNVLSALQEGVQGIRIIKAYVGENREIEKFNRANRLFFKQMFQERRLRFATSPINEVILVGMLVSLLWYGGHLVYSGSGLTAEDFIRFLVFLFTTFQPIKDFSGVNNTVQTGMAAAERIFGIIEVKPETYENPKAKTVSVFQKDIVFNDVSFFYDPETPPVLDHINLSIKKGSTVAFVGHSGAGKTTLVNLVPRFYDVTSGALLLDGRDVRELDLRALRSMISIVTQDTILFNDTIRMNIAYARPEASEEDIIHAAKAANAWEFIQKLELGLDAPIGEKGTRLSGGQKQRLSIARAILKNPPILILDEATSALDSESERLVQEAITKLMNNRTVLVIAHRLSTITGADNIVVMQDGRIEAMGTHSVLLEESDLYRMLSKNQFIEM